MSDRKPPLEVWIAIRNDGVLYRASASTVPPVMEYVGGSIWQRYVLADTPPAHTEFTLSGHAFAVPDVVAEEVYNALVLLRDWRKEQTPPRKPRKRRATK